MPRRKIDPRVMMLGAAGILLITTGIRQSMGLFVLPIVATTGLSIVSVSFALAIGQFMWGAAQPVFGAIADHQGAHRVIMAGALLLAAGGVLAPWNSTELGFTLSLGVMMAAGAGAGSFAILIGIAAQCVSPRQRSLAAGLINAGGSAGQLLFAPLTQFLIGSSGWGVGIRVIALSSLLTLPIAWLLRTDRGAGVAARDAEPGVAERACLVAERASQRQLGMREQLRAALNDRSYLCLHAGFFTCGFHIGFLVTHLPGDLQMCGLKATVAANSLALIGLCNIGGSVAVGWLGGRYRMKSLLALLYASRAAIIVCYLMMPKTAGNVYWVSGALGLTWLATVPPTAGLVGKLFGTRYLTTLFGLTFLSHQIGAFLGAWLGGVAIARLGSYDWMWYADIALALAAALVNLPIREAPPSRSVEQPAPA